MAPAVGATHAAEYAGFLTVPALSVSISVLLCLCLCGLCVTGARPEHRCLARG